jgi:hypothetical protein
MVIYIGYFCTLVLRIDPREFLFHSMNYGSDKEVLFLPSNGRTIEYHHLCYVEN